MTPEINVAINWSTVIISIAGSMLAIILPSAIAIAVAWGRIKQTLDGYAEKFATYTKSLEKHESRLEKGEDEFKEQRSTDADIKQILTRIETACKGCRRDIDRNENDHEGFRARISNLELLVATLPGSIATQMEERFESWRKYIRADIESMLGVDKKAG